MGFEQHAPVENGQYGLNAICYIAVPEFQRTAPFCLPFRVQKDDQVQPSLFFTDGMQVVVYMNIQETVGATLVQAVTVTVFDCFQLFDTGNLFNCSSYVSVGNLVA